MHNKLNSWMKRLAVGTFAWLCTASGLGCGSDVKPAFTGDRVPTTVLRQMIVDDKERIAGVDSPRHLARTYLGVDCTHDDNVFDSIVHVAFKAPANMIGYFQGDRMLRWATEMENTQLPDIRRAGILRLVQERAARKLPYTRRYAQIAAYDKDYTVRAAAIRALNYSRNREAASVYAAGLDDLDVSIRLESAKAIGNMPDEKVLKKLIEHLQKDDRDVRIACADALRNFHTVEVARVLISAVSDRDFSVAWQARQSLMLMTGRDFKYEESTWLNYLTKESKPLL